jgi:ubiquitin related modifier 1
MQICIHDIRQSGCSSNHYPFPYSGGLELLFDNIKKHTVPLPAGVNGTIPLSNVLVYMRDQMLTERPELFMQGDTV